MSLKRLWILAVSIFLCGGCKGGAQRKVRDEPVLPAANFGAGAPLQLGVGSLDVRYKPNESLNLQGSELILRGWRGERVSNQLVLQPRVALSQVRVVCAGVSHAQQNLAVQTHFMRYTLADHIPLADIIDSASSIATPAQVNRPIWVSIDIPRSAPVGEYQGTVEVQSDQGAVKMPVKLMVERAPILAEPKHWSFHLDLWQHPDAVARWHDVPLWSPEHFALLKPLMTRLADAGQKTITCTLVHEPWSRDAGENGGQTYDKFESMIGITKKSDGSFVYDYRIFDQWVRFMSEECGYDQAFIHCYTMLPWSLTFRYYDEAKRAFVAEKMQPNSPEYEAFWGSYLADFVKHLREKSWLGRTRMAMDERPDAPMSHAIEVLRRYAPELKISSANDHPSGIARNFDDVSPAFSIFDELGRGWLKERKREKKLSTFYVCLHPKHPNTFTWSPPAEAEWLALFASAQHLDGFLRWAYQSWVENPFASTDFTSWPSGDCFLVYPGNRSSLRFERLRDGIENFEKIRLLREQAAQNPSPNVAAAWKNLEAELQEFTPRNGMKNTGHTEAVSRVNQAIIDLAHALSPP